MDGDVMCRFFHRWSKYEEPTLVNSPSGALIFAQRRVCTRCNAVDYRRVDSHL